MSSLYPRTCPNQKCRCGSQVKYKYCCKNKDMVDKLSAMYKHQFPDKFSDDEEYGMMALRNMFPTYQFRWATPEDEAEFKAEQTVAKNEN